MVSKHVLKLLLKLGHLVQPVLLQAMPFAPLKRITSSTSLALSPSSYPTAFGFALLDAHPVVEAVEQRKRSTQRRV
eukprot:COSAG06_NODE_61292_length_268_cov_0.609467_1_plen_75_part_10